jgi:hypothetical protein
MKALKKTGLGLIITTVALFCLIFSVSAAEERVVIDNVVYELTSQKYYYDRLDYGEHYAVTDFIEDETLAETTTKINIVDEIDGIEVKTIMTNFDEHDGDEIHYARYGQKYPSVTKISLPGTIKYINDFSFNFFPSVEKLYLPVELERIGWGTFEQMESLKSITLPAGVTYIPERAFRGCINLEKVVVQGDITKIGDSAFSGCEKLASFDFSDTIKYIGDSSFYKTALTKVVIPENADTDEGGAFSNCDKLETIVFEDTSKYPWEYICPSDFLWKCENVKEIYFNTIPAESILFYDDILNQMPLLKDIYFVGSEEKWEKVVSEKDKAELDKKGVTIHFYYNHTHQYRKSGNVTCTKGGTYKYTCDCGDTYSYKVAKNTEGHKFGEWKVKSKSTYTVAGVKERKCSLCGKVEKKNLAMPHLGLLTKCDDTATLNSITITWEAPEGANGCRVYKYNTKTKKYVKVASVKNKTTYTFKNLEKGQNVKYKLQPYYKDSKGNVAFGRESVAFSSYTLATAPVNLKAESTDVGVVKLSWDSSGTDVYYYVKYNTSKEALENDEGKHTTSSKKETVTIKNLESGTTYYFIVNMDLLSKTEDGVRTSDIVEVTVK